MARKMSRAQWAAKIRTDCEQTVKEAVKGFLNLGRSLLKAKKELPHGEFLEMIEHDLPFAASKAQRLMKIASNPKIAKAAHGQHLPGSWRTLYELTKLDDETFDKAVSDGTIHPSMTRREAKSSVVRIMRGPERNLLPPYIPSQKTVPDRFLSYRMVVREAEAENTTEAEHTTEAKVVPFFSEEKFALWQALRRAEEAVAALIANDNDELAQDPELQSRVQTLIDQLSAFVSNNRAANSA
jgi:hypothetical protein